jgi:hypothetical protein
MIAKVAKFFEKYSFLTHATLTAWNAFIVSWATGTDLPLQSFGLPFSFNARDIMSFIQKHAHIPTWVLVIFGMLANATLYYTNWKKSHVQVVSVPEGSVLVATPDTKEQLESTTVIKAE